jgi:hypothetical protein
MIRMLSCAYLEFVMAGSGSVTISADLSAITKSGSSAASGASGGTSNRAKIAALTKQIETLNKDLMAISKDSTISPKQKEEKAQLIQKQIELINAQIAMLRRQEAQEVQKSAEKKVLEHSNSVTRTEAPKDNPLKPTGALVDTFV